MKVLITVLIFLAAVYLFLQVAGVYDRSVNPHDRALPSAPVQNHAAPAAGGAAAGEQLPGLPPYLEASLAQAEQQGVEAMGKWLKEWGKNVQDPRLAWIELDYIVLLNLRNHREARDRFQQVMNRTPPNSPVAERVRKLAPAYEQ